MKLTKIHRLREGSHIRDGLERLHSLGRVFQAAHLPLEALEHVVQGKGVSGSHRALPLVVSLAKDLLGLLAATLEVPGIVQASQAEVANDVGEAVSLLQTQGWCQGQQLRGKIAGCIVDGVVERRLLQQAAAADQRVV